MFCSFLFRLFLYPLHIALWHEEDSKLERRQEFVENGSQLENESVNSTMHALFSCDQIDFHYMHRIDF